MKKHIKKLSLSRETLRHLELLKGAVGGDCTCTCCTCYTYCGCPASWDGACPGETNEILSGCATNC